MADRWMAVGTGAGADQRLNGGCVCVLELVRGELAGPLGEIRREAPRWRWGRVRCSPSIPLRQLYDRNQLNSSPPF